jgi:hypothetical protein
MDFPFITHSGGLGPDEETSQPWAWFTMMWDTALIDQMGFSVEDGVVNLHAYFLTCTVGTSVSDCIYDTSVNKVVDDLYITFNSPCYSAPTIETRENDAFYVNVTVGEYQTFEGMAPVLNSQQMNCDF